LVDLNGGGPCGRRRRLGTTRSDGAADPQVTLGCLRRFPIRLGVPSCGDSVRRWPRAALSCERARADGRKSGGARLLGGPPRTRCCRGSHWTEPPERRWWAAIVRLHRRFS